MIQAAPSVKTAIAGIVIIPARNEAEAVGNVVRSVRERMDWEILVVDDSSVDDTAKEATENGAHVLSLSFHVGSWGAVQTGMRYALGRGYRLALTMEC